MARVKYVIPQFCPRVLPTNSAVDIKLWGEVHVVAAPSVRDEQKYSESRLKPLITRIDDFVHVTVTLKYNLD